MPALVGSQLTPVCELYVSPHLTAPSANSEAKG